MPLWEGRTDRRSQFTGGFPGDSAGTHPLNPGFSPKLPLFPCPSFRAGARHPALAMIRRMEYRNYRDKSDQERRALMNPFFDQMLAEGYRSRSQKIRVLTEAWVHRNL